MQKTTSSSLQPWLVCLGAALFFYYVFFQLAMFNSISHAVMVDFRLTPTQLGYLSSSYFFADALCIIPAGILLDRYSTRRFSLIVMLACVLTTYLLAMTHSFSGALLSRIVNGIGNAFAFLSSMQLAARWLPAKRLALGISSIITIFMIGGMVAQTPLMLLVNWLGWRSAMLVNASIGILFLVYMWRYLQDYPAGSQPLITTKTMGDMINQFKQAIQSYQNWLSAAYITLMNFPIILLGELWGILYLTQSQQLTLASAGNITSMLFLGMIIGSPLLGWISDQCERRRLPMQICALLLLLVSLLVMFNQHLSTAYLSLMFLLLGFLSSAQSIGYPVIAESNSVHITGMAMSIVAVLLNLVSFIVQPLFGWLVHIGWSGQLINNMPVYTSADYHRAMWLLPIACLLALLLTFKIRETHAKGLPYS